VDVVSQQIMHVYSSSINCVMELDNLLSYDRKRRVKTNMDEVMMRIRYQGP
jgi:hypothetical protein